MYMWETGKLAEELKEGSLTQNDIKNYYIATSVIALLGLYFSILEPPEVLNAIKFEAIASVFITVVGLNILFHENGGNKGVEYLNRVISLSFPLLIKVTIVTSIFVMMLGAVYPLEMDSVQSSWLTSIYIVLAQIIVFWRIKKHIQYINT